MLIFLYHDLSFHLGSKKEADTAGKNKCLPEFRHKINFSNTFLAAYYKLELLPQSKQREHPKLIQPCIPVYGLASLLDEQKQAHYFGKRKGRVETSQ